MVTVPMTVVLMEKTRVKLPLGTFSSSKVPLVETEVEIDVPYAVEAPSAPTATPCRTTLPAPDGDVGLLPPQPTRGSPTISNAR